MSAHGVTADSSLLSNRKMAFDQRRQFIYHVVIHLVVAVPWFLGGIYVEAGSLAEVVTALWIVGNTFTAWVARQVPELELDLPLRAIGSGYVD